MGHGLKPHNGQREMALALRAQGHALRYVAEKVGVSKTTVNNWEHEDPDGLEELRKQKKMEFIDEAWEIISLANDQVKARLNRATAGEAAKVAGIYYDKQALANGDPTINANVGMKKLEDWMK